MAKKRYKPLLPKILTTEQLHTVTQYSAARLGDDAIAAVLDCSIEEFLDRKESDLMLKNALIRGSAEMAKNCAVIVMAAAQGKPIGNPPMPVTDQQFKAAQFYLEKHSEFWLKD